MTVQPADTEPGAVPEEAPLAAVPDPDPVPRIVSDPDRGGVKSFELAYEGPDGDEVVVLLHYRKIPPFAIYRRWLDLVNAQETKIPERVLDALRPFLRVAMPIPDANRLLDLIDGDEDKVGRVTADALSDITELIRANAYDAPKPVPPSPGSSNGPRSTGRSSSAKKSSPGSKSTASRRKKR